LAGEGGAVTTATAGLADDLRRALADEPFGLSGRELARRVHRRHVDVLTALRADPGIEHEGRTRGSRWRLRRRAGANGNRSAGDELPWAELDAAGIPALGRRAEATPGA
jgi:hypothetical protein